MSHTLGQDLHSVPHWTNVETGLERGSDFPEAILLLLPTLLPTSSLVLTPRPRPRPMYFLLLPLQHVLSSSVPGPEALDHKDLRSYPVQALLEWMGEGPREREELPKATEQNEIWAKGSCISMFPISLRSHRSWATLPSGGHWLSLLVPNHKVLTKTWAHMEPASSQVHLQLAVCPPASHIPL